MRTVRPITSIALVLSGLLWSTGSSATFTGTGVWHRVVCAPVPGVNDAPALDASKSPALSSVRVNAGVPVGAVGTLASDLVHYASPAGQVDNVSDVDVVEGEPSQPGIAVIAANSGNGSWYYTTNGGTNWFALGAPSGAASRLLAADAGTRVYFQPNAGFSGTLAAALTIRAWDRSTGTNGGTASTITNGEVHLVCSMTCLPEYRCDPAVSDNRISIGVCPVGHLPNARTALWRAPRVHRSGPYPLSRSVVRFEGPTGVAR